MNVKANNLTKSYGDKVVVNDISFECKSGEILALAIVFSAYLIVGVIISLLTLKKRLK